MVLEDQIKWYLPLHELDELKPTQEDIAVDLSANDLFLISKVSAYSTDSENAVTVSKKLSYKNLTKKISDDFDIYKMKMDIVYLSDNLSTLSGELCATSSFLYDTISCVSSFLSTSIDTLSTNVYTTINDVSTFLSGSIDQLCTDLSATVVADYIKKYGSQTCAFITTESVEVSVLDQNGNPLFDDAGNPIMTSILTANLAQTVTLSNGQITDIKTIGVDEVFSLQGKTIAAGIIYGDYYSLSTIVQQNENENELIYTTQKGCYLDISLSVVESDSSPSPLEIGISADYGFTFRPIAQFNNPGGFQGLHYVNYYHVNVPIAQNKTIVVRYANGEIAMPNSAMRVIEYKFYAIDAQSELGNYAKKPEQSLSPEVNELNLYDIEIDYVNGTILSARKHIIEPATPDVPGLIATRDTQKVENGYEYGLSIDQDSKGYVYVPIATRDTAGVICISADNDNQTVIRNDGAFTKHSVRLDNNNRAYVEVPVANADSYGAIKLGASDSGTVHPVKLNSENKAFVEVPVANSSRPGVIRISASDGDIQHPVKLDRDNNAYVDVPVATASRAGVIQLDGNIPSGGTVTPVYLSNNKAYVKYDKGLTVLGWPYAVPLLNDNDGILVNLEANNTKISKYIPFTYMRAQLAGDIRNYNIVPPTGGYEVQVSGIPYQNSNSFVACTCTTPYTGWYRFLAIYNPGLNSYWGGDDLDLWCEIWVNNRWAVSANDSYFSYIMYLPAGVPVTFNAWRSKSNTNFASGQRQILFLG